MSGSNNNTKKESTTDRKILWYKIRRLRFSTEMGKLEGIALCLTCLLIRLRAYPPLLLPPRTCLDILASMGISIAFPSEMRFQLQASQALIRMRDYKVTSFCCSSPLIIYPLLSMCVEVWRAASLNSGPPGRERWNRLNSVALKRDSKRGLWRAFTNLWMLWRRFHWEPVVQELVTGSEGTEEELFFQTQDSYSVELLFIGGSNQNQVQQGF